LHHVGGFKTATAACLALQAGAAAWLAAFTPVEIITVDNKEAAAAAMRARWFM